MRRRGFRRGLSLIEVMAGVMVLAATVVAATAMFPLAAFLRDRSGGYSRAAAIGQRKLEQIRRLPYSQLTYNGLLNARVIDASAGSSYAFTTVDNLPGELSQAAGSVQLSNAGTDLTRADVTITWRGLRGTQQQFTATTFVGSKDFWVVR